MQADRFTDIVRVFFTKQVGYLVSLDLYNFQKYIMYKSNVYFILKRKNFSNLNISLDTKSHRLTEIVIHQEKKKLRGIEEGR